MTNDAKPDVWMPLVIGDYHKDTGRLSTEQHGAYLLLIMDYWVSGPPADDDAELCAITGLDARTWKKHRPKLAKFFRVQDGVWRHKRVDEELERWTAKKAKYAERAASGGRAKAAKSTASSSATSTKNSAEKAAPQPASPEEEDQQRSSSLRRGQPSADRPDGPASSVPEPEPTEPSHIARQALMQELGLEFVAKFFDGCVIEAGILRPANDIAKGRLERDAAAILARYEITIGEAIGPALRGIG